MEARDLRDRIDDLLGNTVAEVLVLWIRTHVGKRENRNGRFLGLNSSRFCSEGFAEFADRTEPVGRGLGERPRDRFSDLPADSRTHRRNGRHRICQVSRHHCHGSRCGERRIARQKLIENARKRVHVTAIVDVQVTGHLLRTHVVRCTQRHSSLGEPLTSRRTHRERDPEIRHHRLAFVQQDVLRLDVTVDDVLAMGMVESIRHGFGDCDCLLNADLLLPIQKNAK